VVLVMAVVGLAVLVVSLTVLVVSFPLGPLPAPPAEVEAAHPLSRVRYLPLAFVPPPAEQLPGRGGVVQPAEEGTVHLLAGRLGGCAEERC
jgi:hypothetical protein